MLEIQKKLSNSFYALLALPSTAMGFALSIQISALSWIMSTQYHLNLEEVGFVWAAGPAAGIIGQVVVGRISDDVWFWGGRRRPFILIGGVLAAVMLLALPNIGAIHSALGLGSLMVVALVVALTLDLAINISFNPTRSIISDVTPEGVQRTKGYTWMQTISGFFGVLAYLITVIFDNYTLIYGGVFLVLLFSIVPTILIKENKVLIAPVEKASKEASIIKTQWPELIKIYMAHGFSWFGIQTMFVFMYSFIQEVIQGPNANANETGTIIAISFAILNTIGFILPAFVLEPITEKIGRVKTHLICVAFMALGYFGIYAFARTSMSLYILMAVCGIGWSAVVSLPFAIMTEKINKAKTGLFMGIFNLSVVIPQLLVSLTIGSALKNADKEMLFLVSGISLAISAFLWIFVKERRKDVVA